MDLSVSDKINFGIASTCVAAVIWMFTTFVRAEEFHQKITDITVAVAYGQYYDRLDDYDEAKAEGNEELAKEYKRQMERLRAEICEHDPEWERCKDAADGRT